MNGVYWGLVALCIMDKQDALDSEEMIKYVMSCWDEETGETAGPWHLEELLPQD
jgi:geranylgeranyl transferase type-2 subunit beta